MATVDITPSAEADIRGLGLDLGQQIALVAGMIEQLSFMPNRHPPCPSAGPAAHKYHQDQWLVVYDVFGTPGTETVWVLQVMAARGRFAAMALV